jgi:hypothetical protein
MLFRISSGMLVAGIACILNVVRWVARITTHMYFDLPHRDLKENVLLAPDSRLCGMAVFILIQISLRGFQVPGGIDNIVSVCL